MDRNDVLARIACEARTYHLPATTALDAYADILADLADGLAGCGNTPRRKRPFSIYAPAVAQSFALCNFSANQPFLKRCEVDSALISAVSRRYGRICASDRIRTRL